jgi:hypothetical protein
MTQEKLQSVDKKATEATPQEIGSEPAESDAQGDPAVSDVFKRTSKPKERVRDRIKKRIKKWIGSCANNPKTIFYGAESIPVWVGFMALLALKGHPIWEWYWAIAWAECTVLLMLYAPKIPKWQVPLTFATIIAIHYGIEYLAFEGHWTWTLLLLDLVLAGVMASVSRYWIKKGHITKDQGSVE